MNGSEDRFDKTYVGYVEAVIYLKRVGRLEEFENNPVSTDGHSLIMFANSVAEEESNEQHN